VVTGTRAGARGSTTARRRDGHGIWPVQDTVVKHYQWMLATDFLPRIVEPGIVTDVLTHGRKFFEVAPGTTTRAGTRRLSVPAKHFGQAGSQATGPG
jgi:hypothetical protein